MLVMNDCLVLNSYCGWVTPLRKNQKAKIYHYEQYTIVDKRLALVSVRPQFKSWLCHLLWSILPSLLQKKALLLEIQWRKGICNFIEAGKDKAYSAIVSSHDTGFRNWLDSIASTWHNLPSAGGWNHQLRTLLDFYQGGPLGLNRKWGQLSGGKK